MSNPESPLVLSVHDTRIVVELTGAACTTEGAGVVVAWAGVATVRRVPAVSTTTVDNRRNDFRHERVMPADCRPDLTRYLVETLPSGGRAETAITRNTVDRHHLFGGSSTGGTVPIML